MLSLLLNFGARTVRLECPQAYDTSLVIDVPASQDSLSLCGMQLTALPPDIGQLTSITQLNVYNNQLRELPPDIGRLTNLVALSIGSNQLQTLSPDIGLLTNLKELNINNNQLTVLPPDIAMLTNLSVLEASCNKLTALPRGIDRLTSLTRLLISGNQLTTLPAGIGRLTNLTQLTLGGNQLKALPPDISGLSNLTQLWVSGNQLRALPPDIARLTSLTQLNAHKNQLRALPPDIGRLTNLTELDVSDNQLAVLPSEIGGLTNLRQLEVYGNPIVDAEIQHLGCLGTNGQKVKDVAGLLLLLQRQTAVASSSSGPLTEAAACLEVFELGLGAHAVAFEGNMIKGKFLAKISRDRDPLYRAGVVGDMLLHLRDEDLKELGIEAMGQRDELVELVEKLHRDLNAALVEFFVPASFMCPITLQLMDDPVVAPDGNTYEAAAIQKWLDCHTTSPLTGMPMAKEPLVHCRTLRNDIQAFRERSGSLH
eukprot:m51a1_g10980 putative leucine rich repeat protein (482) ;mRNA; r:292589-295662